MWTIRRKIFITLFVIVLLNSLFFTSTISARTKVTLWTFAPMLQEQWQARKPDIDRQFGINLNVVLVAQNVFINKLETAIRSQRNYPDIIQWIYENNRILSIDSEKCPVIPLEEYTETSTVFPEISPGRVSFGKYGPHIYGLPMDAHPCVLIYNDTLWKSAGIDLNDIETWDDFFDAAQKLCAKKRNTKALPQNGCLTGTMYMIMQQSGVQILTESGKPQFTNPDFEEFVQKWLKWDETGTMCDWDWANFGTMFKKGTMASFPSPDWWVSQVNEAWKDGKYKIKARPLPLYPGSDCPTATWGGSFLAIVKLAQNQDQLYQIIEYMVSERSEAVNRYCDTGMLPPVATIWDDSAFHRTDLRFGGQRLGELQVEMAGQIPSLTMGDIFWDALVDFNDQYPKIQNGRLSVAEGCQAAQEKAMYRLSN